MNTIMMHIKRWILMLAVAGGQRARSRPGRAERSADRLSVIRRARPGHHGGNPRRRAEPARHERSAGFRNRRGGARHQGLPADAQSRPGPARTDPMADRLPPRGAQRPARAAETRAATRPGGKPAPAVELPEHPLLDLLGTHGPCRKSITGDGVSALGPDAAEPATRRIGAAGDQGRRRCRARHARTALQRPPA